MITATDAKLEKLDSFLVSQDALLQSAHLADTVLQPGESVDGLTAVALIGRGSSCEVWRMHDDREHRDVALKLFRSNSFDARRGRSSRPTETSTLRERFLAEARLLASTIHPNLIRVFSSGTFRGEPYFTMELLRPLPVKMTARQITALGLDLCRALEHLHSLGVIHRDLKPDNVLVASDGRYVLADLGIAALHDDALSDFIRGEARHNPTIADGNDHAIGTPGYAAPEQMSGKPVSPSADIHALGVLFNTLFDGHAPFLWRILIRRMTSTLPAFRLQSVAGVRSALLALKFRLVALSLAAILVIGALGWGYYVRETTWTELPDSAFGSEQKTPPHVTVKLPANRKYYLPSLNVNPQIAEVTPGCFTNIPLQFLVVGPGVLKCDSTRWCELVPTNGAQVITGKKFP